MLDSTEVLEAAGAAAGWREVARFPYAAQGLAGAAISNTVYMTGQWSVGEVRELEYLCIPGLRRRHRTSALEERHLEVQCRAGGVAGHSSDIANHCFV